ncbi:MAG: hypothetical protein JWO03_707 [Bacteroidetes bacterium]|nr:hypothetical protein [Bacteroidota bacterium]
MRNLCGLLLILTSLISKAQSLTGLVLDGESHALAFVTVSNAKAQLGSYTDETGRYTFDVSSLAQTDEILFSHIGFEEVKMTVAQLAAVKDPILLKAKNYGLKQIDVHPTDAKSELMDALSRIKDNYPGEFTKNHIIFKDYSVVTRESNHYNYFDFNMYLPSYLAKDSPRIYTVDNKHEVYEQKGALFHVQVPPTVLLKLMYPERLFSEKQRNENDFSFVSSTAKIDDEEYDVINFTRKPQKGDKSVRASGNVYINKKDKGIRYIEVHVYNEKPERYMLIAKMDTLNVNAKIAFTKIDGKYMLDYISQTTYASGKLFGKHENLVYTTTAKVVDRVTKLKMNEIVMRSEVDDIVLNEKPKDIKELKNAPDMR